MKIVNIIPAFLILLITTVATAQPTDVEEKSFFKDATDFIQESKLSKADKLYDHFAYSEAIGLYHELATANYQLKHVSQRLADSYRRTGKISLAAEWYAKVVENDSVQAEDVFNYAQVLRSSGKYDESQIWMAKFNSMNSNDSRGKQYLSSSDFVEKMKGMPERFTIENAENLNSQYSDFGAFFIRGKLVFASARDDGTSVKNSYAWDGKPFLDIYYSLNSNFAEIKPISKKINTSYHEGPACFDTTGMVMYFTRNIITKGRVAAKGKEVNHFELLRSEYRDGDWQNITRLPFNGTEYSVGHPSLSQDGKKLYFASSVPGGVGGSDLYYAVVNGDGTFGSPVNLGPEINTEGNEGFPFIHPSGVLYFASDGHVGFGGMDIFYSFQKKSGDFQPPVNLGFPINGERDDFSFWLDKKQKGGYFSSNRPDGAGDDDIYSFKMAKPILSEFIVKVVAQDKETSAPLEGVMLQAISIDGTVLAEVVSGKDGSFKLSVEPGASFVVKANTPKYLDAEKECSTDKLEEGQEEMTFIVPLEKDPGYTLVCLVTDKATGKPIKGVNIHIVEKNTKKDVINIDTPEDGKFSEKLEDKKAGDVLEYSITIHCNGYLEKKIDYTRKLAKPGSILLHKELDFKLDKIDVGTDLAKIIDIKPIYFDVNKSDIRPDAAIELDKIVKVMTENPNMTIELGSHTDCRGSDAYNLSLSDRRAKSSAKYIVSKGVDNKRITGKGFGETKLINKCDDGVNCTDDEHQANRRTEFIIVKM